MRTKAERKRQAMERRQARRTKRAERACGNAGERSAERGSVAAAFVAIMAAFAVAFVLAFASLCHAGSDWLLYVERGGTEYAAGLRTDVELYDTLRACVAAADVVHDEDTAADGRTDFPVVACERVAWCGQ